MASADNAFGFRLLGALQKIRPNHNVVISPVSAALDLSMLLNGAEGRTLKELLDLLSLGESPPRDIDAANSQLIKSIRAPAADVILSVANSLWIDDRRATLRPDYLKRTQDAYEADLVDLDFSSPDAPGRINGWASKQTHGRITRVLDTIAPDEVMLLLDAVYFKGQWTHKFDPARTQMHDFTLATGAVKQVPRMAQAARFDYFETPQMQAIRLPFGEGDLNLLVLLPAATSTVTALEDALTAAQWTEWQSHYAPRRGSIELPRFELKSDTQLNEALQALGMKRAFEPGAAQFSRMLTSAPDPTHGGRSAHAGFSVSAVRQSAYWKVDEEGAEAAAVTTTGVRATAMQRPEPPFQMIVDRPFLCAIEDRRSGALLFLGAIHDPSP